MAKITFNSETYSAFLAEKKCCIATQASEYIDAMYSASSDADCLLDELRENIYYLKFLEIDYVRRIEYGSGGIDYSGQLPPGSAFTDSIDLNYYNLNGGLISTFSFSFISNAVPGAIGSASYIENFLISQFESEDFKNVQVSVTYTYPILSIQINADNLYFPPVYLDSPKIGIVATLIPLTNSSNYVYSSENTNCLTDDDAIKLSNLMHCDCCN
jgi:hypothetical protein